MNRRTLLLTLLGIALCLVGLLRVAIILPSRSTHNDFAHYYVSSRLLLEGRDPYYAPFAYEYGRLGLEYDPRVFSATNPPPLVFLTQPLALLEPRPAFYIWTTVQGLALAVTLLLLWRILGNRTSMDGFLVLAGALVVAGATYRDFYFGQIQLLLGAIILGAYVLHVEGRPAIAWLLVTIACLLKLFPLVLLPWFVWKGSGRASEKLLRLMPSLLVTAAVFAVTVPLWPGFLGSGLAAVKSNVINQTGNYSAFSFVVNLGHALANFSPSPALAASLWSAGAICAALLVVAAYAVCVNGRTQLENQLCLLLLTTLLASPTAWDHYFVLAFLPFCVFALATLNQPSTKRVVAVVLVYFGTLHLMNLGGLVTHPVLKVLLSYLPTYVVFGLALWFVRRLGLHNAGRPTVHVEE